jgi:hypothetical protein
LAAERCWEGALVRVSGRAASIRETINATVAIFPITQDNKEQLALELVTAERGKHSCVFTAPAGS